MIQESIATVKSIATVIKLASGLKKISDDVQFDAQVAEIVERLTTSQEQALIAQAKAQELLKVKDELEKELTEYKNWDKEKIHYALKEISPNVFVYAYQKKEGSSEPPHWLCTNCYTDDKKSILQLKGVHDTEYPNTYFCKKCGLELNF